MFPWIEDFETQDAALLEQSSEEQQGPGTHSLLHLPIETSEQEVSGVELISNHSEPDSIQDIVLEAQHRASFQSTLDHISGQYFKSQGFVGEQMLMEWYCWSL